MTAAAALKPPPPALSTRSLPLESMTATLYRIHSSGQSPIFASHASGRFSSPSLPFGVCYLSLSPLGAFAETCLADFGEGGPGGPFTLGATGAFLQSRALSVLRVHPPLKGVPLDSNRIAGIPLSSLINNSSDHALTQRWAAAFHDHPDHPDALCYFASRAPQERSVAVFERALSHLSVLDTRPLLEDRGLIRECERKLGLTDVDPLS